MLKHLHRIILTICFTCLIAFNPNAQAKNDLIALESITPEQMKLIQKDVKVNDLDIEPINTQSIKKEVVPDTKREAKKLAAYLIRGFCVVLLSGILIFFILLFVKKYYSSAFVNPDEEDYFESFDLSTPDNRQDALKAFLNRSK